MWEIGLLAIVVVAVLLAKPKKIKNLMITKKDGNDILYKSIWALHGLRSGPSQYENSSESTNEPKTMFDLLTYSFGKYKQNDLFGFRSLIQTIKEVKNGKDFLFYQLSGYKWMTMSLFYQRALALGKYFAHSLKPKEVVCIFASTSIEWQLVAHAAWSQNIIISTAYDTLGADGLEYSLKETEAKFIYCTSDQFAILADVVSKVKLSKIIYKQGINTTIKETDAFIEKLSKYCECVNIEEAIIHGDPLELPTRPPVPEDIACIMYTSGSTGVPKGCVITHLNMMATVGSAKDLLTGYVGESDTYLAYLPLAHIMELAIESCCLYLGIQLGYGSPRTLTDQFTRGCNGDIKELRPSILVGVPQVWDTIRKGIMAKLEKAPGPVRVIFWGAYRLKQWSIDRGLPMAHVADLVFKKIRDQTGGRLKLALSGGSPLNPNTQTFLTNVLCPLYVGYGMTETVGMGCLMVPAVGWMAGVVGLPMPSVEIKLVDVPEAGYSTKNNPPNGEIWIRGPSICKGYFKQPKTTAAAFEDGWLKTGDIGEIVVFDNTPIQRHNEVQTSTGVFRIIDRKKNLVKMSNGEYIALEVLESTYKQNKLVLNVMVAANSECKLPIIIVQVNEAHFMEFAKKFNQTEFKEARVALRVEMLTSLLNTGKEYNLKGTSLVGDVIISDDEWTPQNGLLTAAMKLQRRNIEKRFETEVKAAYELLK